MSIKKFLRIMGLSVFVLMVGTFISMVLLNSALHDERVSVKRITELNSSAIELRNVSDYLTDQAIRYAEMSEKKYVDNYQKEISKSKTKEEIMRSLKDLGASEEELSLIESALNKFDKLKEIEKDTIKAVDNNEFSKLDNLIYGVSYEDNKIEFHKNVETFKEKIHERTEKEVNTARFRSISTYVVVCIFIGVLIILVIITFIILTKKISKLLIINHRLKELSNNEGDLTARVDLNSKDEIGEIARSFNKMLDSLQCLIKETKHIVIKTNLQSGETKETTKNICNSNKQIGLTMEQMSASIQEQAASFSSISNTSREFIEVMKKYDENGRDLMTASNEILSLSTGGNGIIQNSVEQMSLINTKVNHAVKKVSELDEKTNEINKLVEVIKSISEQTNLLALNAAIEAARTGEAGKGFTVVAEEIRNLATQSEKSVFEITGVVDSIQQESKLVTNSLKDSYVEVEKGTVQIMNFAQTFEHISSEVLNMVDKIEVISDNTHILFENSQKIDVEIEKNAAVAEETSAGIEEITASVNEQDTLMVELLNDAIKLGELSKSLNEMIKKFKA